jgi:hypothetical protein
MSKHLHCAQAAEPLATGRANNFRFDVNDKPARQAASLIPPRVFHNHLADDAFITTWAWSKNVLSIEARGLGC